MVNLVVHDYALTTLTSFCAALELDTSRGKRRLMYRGRLTGNGDPQGGFVREVCEFPNLETMMKEFPDIFNKLTWVEINPNNAYGITDEMVWSVVRR